MSRLKIGFHTGPGGNRDGIGEYWHSLDAVGIPFVQKGVDDYGPCGEAAVISAGSGVPHVIAFRLSTAGQNDGYDYDVPNYHIPPEEAAVDHWQHTLAKLPDIYDSSRVWLEVINEVDHERADWLGWFGVRIAELAIESGFKVALFAWSTGEPEPADWFAPGMVAYLNKCAQHPDQVAIALHEYSLDVNNIWNQRDYLIGRFQQLYDAVDVLGIAPPKVLITEWGWTLNQVPAPDQAIADIDAVMNDLYAYYPQLLGAAIWYLGGGFGGIATLAQRLISPVKNLALTKDYPDPEPIECRGTPRTQYGRTFVYFDPSLSYETCLEIFSQRFAEGNKNTFGWSADDAGIGDLDVRNIEAYGVQNQTLMRSWWETNYPGVSVNFIDWPPAPPPEGSARLGIHMSADSYDMVGDRSVVTAAKPEIIKFLSSHNPIDVSWAVSTFPAVPVVIRAFLNWGGRTISPQQFVEWTLPDVQRTVSRINDGRQVYIEIGNEPNLKAEGWTYSWNDGGQYAVWAGQVLSAYRSALPGLSMVFPGLSPGGTVGGVRTDSWVFLSKATALVSSCDALGVHVYFSPETGWSVDGALEEVRRYAAMFPGKPILVTEASHNTGTATAEQKAAYYLQFWNGLKTISQVLGVTFFVLSASNPAWGWNGGSRETWVTLIGGSVGIAEIVGAR